MILTSGFKNSLKLFSCLKFVMGYKLYNVFLFYWEEGACKMKNNFSYWEYVDTWLVLLMLLSLKFIYWGCLAYNINHNSMKSHLRTLSNNSTTYKKVFFIIFQKRWFHTFLYRLYKLMPLAPFKNMYCLF